MKRENLLVGLVLFLVLLNAVILYLFLSNDNRPGGGPPRHDKVIIETLKFDEQQQLAFEQLKFQHRSAIVEIDNQFEPTLEAYFLLLRNDSSSSVTKDSLELVIGNLEKQKARITFSHFSDLRKLCREDQKAAFDRFIPELFRFIMPPRPKNPPPPRRNG